MHVLFLLLSTKRPLWKTGGRIPEIPFSTGPTSSSFSFLFLYIRRRKTENRAMSDE
jgi:hypothetical protein